MAFFMRIKEHYGTDRKIATRKTTDQKVRGSNPCGCASNQALLAIEARYAKKSMLTGAGLVRGTDRQGGAFSEGF
jgi:hypothetical protein